MRALLALTALLALSPAASALEPSAASPLRQTATDPGCSLAALSQDGDVTIDWRCVEAEAARGAAFAKILKSIRDGNAKAK